MQIDNDLMCLKYLCENLDSYLEPFQQLWTEK